jgi:hypothetical protein
MASQADRSQSFAVKRASIVSGANCRVPTWPRASASTASSRGVPRARPSAESAPFRAGARAARSDSAAFHLKSNVSPRRAPVAERRTVRPSSCARSTVSASARTAADSASFASVPISAGSGASPPVRLTEPSTSTRVTSSFVARRSAMAVRPFRSMPAAAAKGASAGIVTLAVPLGSPPALAWPSTASSGWLSAKSTGRVGSSRRAFARSRTGAAANRSGRAPGIRKPSTIACSAIAPLLPERSASSSRNAASPACTPRMRSLTFASGMAYGPFTCP